MSRLTIFVVLFGMAVANVPAVLDMASSHRTGLVMISSDDGGDDSDPATEIQDCSVQAACSMHAILASTAQATAPKPPVRRQAARQWSVTLDPGSPPSPPPKASTRA